MISPRQVAQIEQYRPHAPKIVLVQMLVHGLVTGLNEAKPVGCLGGVALNLFSGGIESLGLNVKPDDPPAGSHFLNQKQRIVPIAHGRVNCEVLRPNRLPCK